MGTQSNYNGWTNWETWHTALLIDNTQETNRQSYALALRCAKIRAGMVKGKVWDEARAVQAFKRAFSKQGTETKLFYLANREAYHGGWNEPIEKINWREIAINAIDEAANELTQ